MLNIYVAAPWKRGGDANELAAELSKAGFLISSNWLKRSKVNLDSDYAKDPNPDLALWRTEAENDILDITNSDAMVVLNSCPSEGKVIEQGIALAFCIPIVIIGPRTNVFQAMDDFRTVSSTEEAIECLKTLESE